MPERGAVHTPHLASQLRDFTKLRYGNITPTDIDAFIDFGGKLFVIIEAKLPDVTIPFGQRLAIERLIDACQPQVEAIGIICTHSNHTGLIDFALAQVDEYRYASQWNKPQGKITVKNAIETMLIRVGLTYLIEDKT